MDKSIIPECYADTLLVEILVPPNRGYNHQHSCTKVEAVVRNLDEFALGIIDNDKRQIEYLKEFEIIDEEKGRLVLWRHKNDKIHHWFVQICPALEKWILDICEEEDIDLSDFGENKFEGLKYYTKSLERLDSPKLKKLFYSIKGKSENRSVRKLTGWIKLLKDNTYIVDFNELRNA